MYFQILCYKYTDNKLQNFFPTKFQIKINGLVILNNQITDKQNQKVNFFFAKLCEKDNLLEPYVKGLNFLYTEYDPNYEKDALVKYIFTFKIVNKINRENIL